MLKTIRVFPLACGGGRFAGGRGKEKRRKCTQSGFPIKIAPPLLPLLRYRLGEGGLEVEGISGVGKAGDGGRKRIDSEKWGGEPAAAAAAAHLTYRRT